MKVFVYVVFLSTLLGVMGCSKEMKEETTVPALPSSEQGVALQITQEDDAAENEKREGLISVYKTVAPDFEQVLATIPSTSEGANLSVRGFDALKAGNVESARSFFEEVERNYPTEPLGKLGKGWLAFCEGHSHLAMTKFAELADSRRYQPEDDVYRRLALSSIEHSLGK